jgi:hypothetical protein
MLRSLTFVALVLAPMMYGAAAADNSGCPGEKLCSAEDCRKGKTSTRGQHRDNYQKKFGWHSEILWRDETYIDPPRRRYCYFRAVEFFVDRGVVPLTWQAGGLKFGGNAQPGCVVVCSDHSAADEPADNATPGPIVAGPRSEHRKDTKAWSPATALSIAEGTLEPHKRPVHPGSDKVLTSHVAQYSRTARLHLVEFQSLWLGGAKIHYRVVNHGPADIRLIWNFARNQSARAQYPFPGREMLTVHSEKTWEQTIDVEINETDRGTGIAVQQATVEIHMQGSPWATALVPTLVARNATFDLLPRSLWNSETPR